MRVVEHERCECRGPCGEQAPEILRFECREFPEELAAAAVRGADICAGGRAPGRALSGLVHGIDGQERC